MPCRPAKQFAPGCRFRVRSPGQQEDIRFIASEPAQHTIAPESTLQRTVYLEQRGQCGQADDVLDHL